MRELLYGLIGLVIAVFVIQLTIIAAYAGSWAGLWIVGWR